MASVLQKCVFLVFSSYWLNSSGIMSVPLRTEPRISSLLRLHQYPSVTLLPVYLLPPHSSHIFPSCLPTGKKFLARKTAVQHLFISKLKISKKLSAASLSPVLYSWTHASYGNLSIFELETIYLLKFHILIGAGEKLSGNILPLENADLAELKHSV